MNMKDLKWRIIVSMDARSFMVTDGSHDFVFGLKSEATGLVNILNKQSAALKQAKEWLESIEFADVEFDTPRRKVLDTINKLRQ